MTVEVLIKVTPAGECWGEPRAQQRREQGREAALPHPHPLLQKPENKTSSGTQCPLHEDELLKVKGSFPKVKSKSHGFPARHTQAPGSKTHSQKDGEPSNAGRTSQWRKVDGRGRTVNASIFKLRELNWHPPATSIPSYMCVHTNTQPSLLLQ